MKRFLSYFLAVASGFAWGYYIRIPAEPPPIMIFNHPVARVEIWQCWEIDGGVAKKAGLSMWELR